MGAETQSSIAAPTEDEAETDEAGPSRISVNCPSINEINDKIADFIHAIGARDLFRTGYEEQDRNRGDQLSKTRIFNREGNPVTWRSQNTLN